MLAGHSRRPHGPRSGSRAAAVDRRGSGSGTEGSGQRGRRAARGAAGMVRAGDGHDALVTQGEQQREPAARPKSTKTVSFASTVKFTERTVADGGGALSEILVLLLLLALALLAPAGQAIAHVNDIILLYVGYSAIHWVCKSPNSPVADMVWRKCLRGRSRRKGRLSCA